ncbi:MAG: hypothetical protein ACRDT1_06670 [Micromonosporaceae bacterium]
MAAAARKFEVSHDESMDDSFGRLARSQPARTSQPRRSASSRQRSEAVRTQARRDAEDTPSPAPEAPPAPVTAARAPFVTLVLILVATGIVGLLVLNTRINENSFQLEGMRDRQAALDVKEQQLSSQLADKQSPGNLAAAAKRLGLVPAGAPAFLQLPDGRVLGVPQPGGT